MTTYGKEKTRYEYRYIVYRHSIKHLIPLARDSLKVLRGAFAIVYLNAPDFLILALASIRKLHSLDPIIVLDNGSPKLALLKAIELCRRYRCSLLYNTSPFKDHVLALQYILELALDLDLEYIIILDNDVILVSPIDEVLKIMESKGAAIAGPRNLVHIRNEKYLRYAPLAIHASLMIVKPRLVAEAIKTHSIFSSITFRYAKTPEPYHGLSYLYIDKALYFETRIKPELFPLTEYINPKGKVIAYHAWYSSRIRIQKKQYINGINTFYLKIVQENIKQYFKNVIKSRAHSA